MKGNNIDKEKLLKRILIVAVALFVIWFVLSAFIYYSFMNKHISTYQNSRGLASYVEYEKDGLVRKESDFLSSQGKNLCGFFYWQNNNNYDNGVVIVNNGFGSGHEGMLSEIHALTKQGYLVYGFDKTGYDNSDGAIGSLSQGSTDLMYAINHVKENEMTAGMDIILYGKSYGAFCCLAVLDDTDDVTSVVAMSAFNKSSDMITGEVKRMFGAFGQVFVPPLMFFDYINEQDISAVDGLKNTEARVLIMNSVSDGIVSFKDSYEKFQEECAGKDNIEFVRYENKEHDIIKSDSSIAFRKQIDTDLQVFAEQHNEEMTDELWDEFLSEYDLKEGSSVDEEVLGEIIDFLNGR